MREPTREGRVHDEDGVREEIGQLGSLAQGLATRDVEKGADSLKALS